MARFYFLYVWAFCLHIMSVRHMCASARGDQKSPLKLELQLALSCPMGAGTKPGSPKKEVSVLNH